MTEPQHRTTDDQSVGGRGRPDAAPTRTAANTIETIVATADAVQGSLREGHDAAVGVAQQWAGQLAGIPFTALSGGGVEPVVSGRLWVDCTLETVNVLLTVQRRSVDRLLDLQHRTASLMIESGMALATAGWGAGGGTRTARNNGASAS
jgi:hypothetical protein